MRKSIKDAKILFLTSRYLSGYGVGLVVNKQLQGLKKQGISRISVGALDVINDHSEDGISIYNVDFNQTTTHALIGKIQPHIVVAHTPPYYSFVANYRQQNLIKVAYDYGEPFPSFINRSKVSHRTEIDKMKYEAISQFDSHICISEFVKFFSGSKTALVNYLGADHIEDPLTGPVDDNLHKALQFSRNRFLITTLSRIGLGESYYKGFDVLIDIKKRLEHIVPKESLAFLLCGKQAGDGKEIIRNMEAEGFHVITDLSEPLKRHILRESKLYISPSLWEGFDLPLVEAQYVGTPSLALSTGAHPEVCPYHFETIDEIVYFMKSLYANESLRRQCSNICENYVKSKFGWNKSVHEFVCHLSSLYTAS